MNLSQLAYIVKIDGEVDGSRTHLILMDSEAPLPLGHHFETWYPARDSNPNLNVRSVLS